MTEEKNFLLKVVRLLNDPENPDLRGEVTLLRNSSTEYEEIYNQVTYLWNISPDLKSLEGIQAEEALARFTTKLQIEPSGTTETKLTWRQLSWLKGVAAAFLLIGLGSLLYYYILVNTYITKSTLNNTAAVRLADSTVLHLSPNTTIRYPRKFTATREVSLVSGKAQFNVTHNAQRPFIVNIDNAKVTVLGTSFVVNASDKVIGITVSAGKVSFTAGNGAKPSFLIAGSGLIFNKATNNIQYQTFNGNSSELKFVDASLTQVFHTLEKHYNITIKLEDTITSSTKFNALFQNKTLQEVLDVLLATYPIQVKKQDSSVIVITTK